jgi:lipoate-protein ligase A
MNMAVDESMLSEARRTIDHWVPTLRFYSWDSPCVSLGRFQEAKDDDGDRLLDQERCADAAIGVVRRPTGGRAILHNPGDITYSIVARVQHPLLGEDVLASYRSVNEALVKGLHLLGIRATVRERPPMWPSAGVGFGCFEEAYRHEVYWAGRKLVASAQRRQGGVVLQQGTIPGKEIGEQIASLLRLDPARRSRLKRDLAERTGTLHRALDRLPTLEEIVGAMVQGFRETWDVEFERVVLSDRERRLADEIAVSGGVVA